MPKKPVQKKDDTIEVLNYLMDEGYKPPRRRKKAPGVAPNELAATEVGNPEEEKLDDEFAPPVNVSGLA